MVAVVFFRIAYHDKTLPLPMTTMLFKADVMQHEAWALVSDDAQDMRIAERLLKLSVFSPVYSDAGFERLTTKADEGYVPAITRVAALENQGIQVRK